MPMYLLGLELLVYSYAPTGFPTPVCAKVVDKDILTLLVIRAENEDSAIDSLIR